MENENQENRDYTFQVTDNLNRVAWKLQGIAGLLFFEGRGGCVSLDANQANGLSMLIESLAEEIQTNTDRITAARG